MVKKAGVFGILLLLMGIGIVSFYFTTKTTNHMSLEMVAFNYLTDEARALIDRNYNKDQVYSVTFHNIQNPTHLFSSPLFTT